MSIRTLLPSHRSTAVAAVTLAAVSVLAACGDDDGGDTGGSAGGTDAGTTVTATDAATTGDAPAVTATTADDRCHTGGLAVTVGDPEGAAGSVYRTLTFTNSSGADCTLSGYPGVSLVTGADGATQVGAAADREPARQGDAPVITLSPGDTATADLKITNPGVFGDRCTATPADALRVYPPDERDSTVVPVDGLTGCSGEDAPVTLRISQLRG